MFFLEFNLCFFLRIVEYEISHLKWLSYHFKNDYMIIILNSLNLNDVRDEGRIGHTLLTIHHTCKIIPFKTLTVFLLIRS